MTSAPAGPEVAASGAARICPSPSAAACRRASSGRSGPGGGVRGDHDVAPHRPGGDREVECGEGQGPSSPPGPPPPRPRCVRPVRVAGVVGQQAHAGVARLEEPGDGGGGLVERLGQRGAPGKDLRHALQGVQLLLPAPQRLLRDPPLPGLQLEERVGLVELAHASLHDLVHVRAVLLQLHLQHERLAPQDQADGDDHQREGDLREVERVQADDDPVFVDRVEQRGHGEEPGHQAEVAGAVVRRAAVDAEDRVTHEGERDQRERVGHVLQHVRRGLRHDHHATADAPPPA